MLVLVIPQTNTSRFFCFEFETSYYSWCYKDHFLINWVFEGLKKSNTLWLVSVEAESGQSTGSTCMRRVFHI